METRNEKIEHADLERPARAKLHVGLATTPSEILAAQKLRWRVFAEELGATLPTRTPGVDQDFYDAWCEHLIVRDEANGRIVGTYRILSPLAARRVGSYYSENEFDLTRLAHLRPRIVEVGRSCIDPEYRTGATIALLWSGLARYMMDNGYEYLIGCASIGMQDGGHNAVGIYHALAAHEAPPEYRVFPRHPLPLDRIWASPHPEVPPLIKGYLRAGAWVCGEPAWDPDFNTADLLLLLPMSRVNARYARHFVERRV
ncbi:MAG: GNAT family N-acetyltransferase [Pseudomonadota bacterium]|uniref:GNAT family N-acetyltransferase n=1 Tax=Sulfuricystis thermophila TaxID=2496847 RepID=UPI0010361E8B|nr:GNAT family N-acyltransferase [Sulfuricystis thermophila]MDI6749589.1 GNAT family N-acyltransferase [Rhodocyclaceae bacterium]